MRSATGNHQISRALRSVETEMGGAKTVYEVSGAGLGVLAEPHHNPGGRRHNRLHHLDEERRPGRSHRLPKVTQPSSKLQNQALTPRLCVSTFHAQPPHPLASWAALFCHLPTGPLPGDWAPTCCFSGLRVAG